MVAKDNKKPSLIETGLIEIPDSDFNWSSVKLSEVKERQNRLEASIFDIKVKAARQLLKECSSPVVDFWSDDGPIKNAQYPGRFKRIYVAPEDGYPFYLPSQINEINPRPTKWISPLTHSGIDVLKAHNGELLLNRSGTIGPVTIVSRTLDGRILSDDIIRAIPKEPFDLGYIYAFLRTKTGQILLTTNSYGAVISHIEPDHLRSLPIPIPAPLIRININNLISESFNCIDYSNDLIDNAQKTLVDALKLPPISSIESTYFEQGVEFQNYQIKLRKLNNRLDASFHAPITNAIENQLKQTAKELTIIGDKRISSNILLPGRFKRVYVEEGQGTVFIGGKQIFELDPSNKKYLSTAQHGKRISDELKIHQNMILITRSGTIGKINITPRHWNNWIINEHVIRIIPSNDSIAGYIYAWLDTNYGMKLIERFVYGAVVDEIDTNHVGAIQIPLLKDKNTQDKINNLILKANELRSDAYEKEQKAIKMINDLVIHNSKSSLDLAAEPNQKYIKMD